jgi:hypothetical protein
MIVHQIQVAGVPVLEAEYQPVVAGDREAPIAFEIALQGMQLQSG